jgi:hypothetical protein
LKYTESAKPNRLPQISEELPILYVYLSPFSTYMYKFIGKVALDREPVQMVQKV